MHSSTITPIVSAKERLLASAGRLFHEHGINATGIDLVVRNAGVAKASLYNNFANKEALVVAYLEQELDAWIRNAHILDNPLSPRRERIAALFEALARSVELNTFHGCPFTNAVIELPECAAVRTVAKHYRVVVRTHLANLIGADTTSTATSRLVLLYDGAITAAKVGRDAALVREASIMAQEHVDTHTLSALLLTANSRGRGMCISSYPDRLGRTKALEHLRDGDTLVI